MPRSRPIREVLEALEWVRREMMNRGSPDFIRQRQLETRVGALSARLARGPSGQPCTATSDDGSGRRLARGVKQRQAGTQE